MLLHVLYGYVYRYPDMCGYTSPYYNKREGRFFFTRISTSQSNASGRDGSGFGVSGKRYW